MQNFVNLLLTTPHSADMILNDEIGIGLFFDPTRKQRIPAAPGA